MLTLKQTEEVETLKQRKREERDKERQSGDQKVNEIQVQLDKMKAETKVRLATILGLRPNASSQQERAVTSFSRTGGMHYVRVCVCVCGTGAPGKDPAGERGDRPGH